MKLGKSAEKLGKYYDRLKKGKAAKIKLNHVEHMLKKLDKHRKKVIDERDSADGSKKKERLGRKLEVIDDQIERANWLRDKVTAETKS